MTIRAEFEEITADIEKYLGILKGNQTAWEWRENYKNEFFSHYGAPYSPIYPIFQTEPPGGEYACWFQALLLPDKAFSEGQDKSEFGRQINERCAASFANGVNWASGIAGYLNDLCADLIRPDEGNLKQSVQMFRDSMVKVEAALPPNWTDVNFESWIGESSDACQKVVETLQAIVRDNYSTYYAHAFSLYGAACAVAVGAQAGLIDAMKAIRDGIKQNLQYWQNGGYPPVDIDPIDPMVVDIVKIVGKVTAEVPGLGEIQSTATTVAEIGSDILALFDIDTGELLTFEFDAQDAETVFTSMTTMLQDRYLTPLATGMEKIRSEKSTAIVEAQNGIDPWFAPTLEGAADETWRHAQEDEA